MLNIADIRQKLRGYRNILPLSGISFPNFFLIIEDFSVENTLNLGLRGLAPTHASAWTRGCQPENRPNSMQIIAVASNFRPAPVAIGVSGGRWVLTKEYTSTTQPFRHFGVQLDRP
jgi:hypothetical protein